MPRLISTRTAVDETGNRVRLDLGVMEMIAASIELHQNRQLPRSWSHLEFKLEFKQSRANPSRLAGAAAFWYT